MFINVKGVDIHYEIFGSNDADLPPILLLHGWMASIPAMAPIWQYFEKNRKVIAIDFPGQGGESKEPNEPWGVPEYAEMVRDFLNSINVKTVDVIGHSFGGRVIIYLASKYTSLFRKIVLTDAAGLNPKFSFKRWLRVKCFKIGKVFLKITSKNENVYQEKLKNLRKKYGSSDYANLTSDVMRKTFQNVISLDLKENLKKIENPCLIIWGEKDYVTPLYMAKTMEKEIKDSGLVTLKNAGHFSYIDAAREYNIIVENFLGG